jgi:hypothetical protein
MFPFISADGTIYVPEFNTAIGSQGEIGEPPMRAVKPGDPEYGQIKYDLMTLPGFTSSEDE